MSDIKVYALTNGREILGSLAEETATSIKLKDALMLDLVQYPPEAEGQQPRLGLNLIPPTFFVQTTDNGLKGVDIEIFKSALMFTYELSEQVLARYTAQTGKIQIVGANALPKSPIAVGR